MPVHWHSFPGASRPAAPVFLDAELRSKFHGFPIRKQVKAFLDTGSSWSIIPFSLAREMALPISGSQNVRGFDQRLPPVTCPIYKLKLKLPGMDEIEIDALGGERPNVLIGRDICERMLLIINWNLNGAGICRTRTWHSNLRYVFFQP